jgi:hypothetical protein
MRWWRSRSTTSTRSTERDGACSWWGIAGEIADDARRARAEALPLRPWDPGSTERVMVIRPELVSGRRIMPQAQRPWESEMGAPARP